MTQDAGSAAPGRDSGAPGRALIEQALAGGAAALDEDAGKQFFAAYGIAVPQGGTVTSADDAVELATEIGYPVVMKGSSTQIQHKTDAGLVLLRIGDETEVREAYRTLESRAAAAGATLDGVLVEHMVIGKREFVVGLVRDLLFGPVVMFGLGGIYTEALHDVAFAVAPVSEDDAYELMDQIEAKVLLGSFRGEPAVDRAALAKIIMAVGQMAEDHPEIREIDVNPLLIDGATPVAVDALIAVGEPVQGLHPAAGRHLPPGRSGRSGRRRGGGRLVRHRQVGRHDHGQPDPGRVPGPHLPGESQGRRRSSVFPSTRASPSCPRPPTW